MAHRPQLNLVAAVAILVDLAQAPGLPRASDAIAYRHRLDSGDTRRLLVRLASAGLVRIRRGCQGGVWLARPAGAITVLAVARALGQITAPARAARQAAVAGPDPFIRSTVLTMLRAAEELHASQLAAVTIEQLGADALARRRAEGCRRQALRRVTRSRDTGEPGPAPRRFG